MGKELRMSVSSILGMVCPWLAALGLQLREWFSSWGWLGQVGTGEASGKAILFWMGCVAGVLGIGKVVLDIFLAWRRDARDARESELRIQALTKETQ